MSKKTTKTTFIKVGPAAEIFYASRGFAGRGWYVREYHSPVTMKMIKTGKWHLPGGCSEDGPFATKEEAMHCGVGLFRTKRRARRYRARRKAAGERG
jgi:hypothetical protein